MKVQALRTELAKLGLDTTGKKSALQKRLAAARAAVDTVDTVDTNLTVVVEPEGADADVVHAPPAPTGLWGRVTVYLYFIMSWFSWVKDNPITRAASKLKETILGADTYAHLLLSSCVPLRLSAAHASLAVRRARARMRMMSVKTRYTVVSPAHWCDPPPACLPRTPDPVCVR